MPADVGADNEFDRPPISYSATSPDNRVSALQRKIDAGRFTLKHDDQQGYLASVLRGLDVPVESQVLVFSKTSMQIRHISPRTPRAIYFNDDVYVGFCRSGEVLEISVADPQLGTVFYTMFQEQTEEPKFERRGGHCLVCHSSSRTGGVPGHVMRSLYVDSHGTPIMSAASRRVDDATPMEKRWGGWYVTGTHGSQTHLGNLFVAGRRVFEPVDNANGQNVQELDSRFEVGSYLSPHSDIVALMVLEHQILVHNLLTRTSFETRQALAKQESMNVKLGNPPDTRLESTTRRIQSVCEDLVEALLFVGEEKLAEPIVGTSGFTHTFPESGPRDRSGRSLRNLDLKTRLARYPCSYLVHSHAFNELPNEAKEYVWRRLWEVLSGKDPSEKFAHLSVDDRRAIVEILRETLTELPNYWQVNDAGSFLGRTRAN